jgi:2-oxoglutarate ferredoxin oxidoreductase subunit gamma
LEVVASPVVSTYDTVVAMNSLSLLSFQGQVKAGGKLFWDRSLIVEAPRREDVVTIAVDATALATELGSTRVANLVFLGAISGKLGIFSRESARTAMKRMFKNMTAEAFKLNQTAMQKGVEL